ncbi:dipeptidase [Vulcanisaeta sp. JCM 14467]|uniref:dipeptidase n=1 Tax=Vulcanisaeta sp. JCM 14467 TaxID=1295370 RepID=UPI0006D08FF7|nr:dipeptidase [Vulcanisaeta sp. JCM 14467]
MAIPIIDLHEDVSLYFILHGGGEPLSDFNVDIPNRDVDIPKYLRGGVKLVFASIAPSIETFNPELSRSLQELYGVWVPVTKFRSPQSLIIEHFEVYYKMAETYKVISIVESYDDIERVFNEEGKVGFLLHLEGADGIEDPYDLVLLRKLGLRSLGITWNYNNKYGFGCMSRKDYGLTPEGEELVNTAWKLGIIIDLAHACKRTTLEVLAIAKKPVIISHANIKALVDTPRNVDDEVLEALKRNGGVIGLSAIGSIISRKSRPTIDDLIKHFMYVYERFGPDILAIGTDFMGLLGIPPPQGFELIDKTQTLLQKLMERRLTDKDIRKIAYENALRVIKANMA